MTEQAPTYNNLLEEVIRLRELDIRNNIINAALIHTLGPEVCITIHNIDEVIMTKRMVGCVKRIDDSLYIKVALVHDEENFPTNKYQHE